MAEMDDLEPKLASTFFKKKVFPSVKKYQVEHPNFEPDSAPSDEPLIVDLLIKCITSFKIPIQEVSLQLFKAIHALLFDCVFLSVHTIQ